jgi:hypothetical protein
MAPKYCFGVECTCRLRSHFGGHLLLALRHRSSPKLKHLKVSTLPQKSTPQFFLYFNRSVSSWPDTMMIYHQMSLRAAIGNASALHTTRIHEYMSVAESCFGKINCWVWQKCSGTRVTYCFYNIQTKSPDKSYSLGSDTQLEKTL